MRELGDRDDLDNITATQRLNTPNNALGARAAISDSTLILFVAQQISAEATLLKPVLRLGHHRPALILGGPERTRATTRNLAVRLIAAGD